MKLGRCGVLVLVVVSLVGSFLQGAVPLGDWRVSGKDTSNTHFSTLDRITKANVGRLQIAWRYHAGHSDSALRTSMECTPLIVNGVMYVTSPVLEVIALDAMTGREIWKFNPFPEEPSYRRTWLAAVVALIGTLVFAYLLVRWVRSRRARKALFHQFFAVLLFAVLIDQPTVSTRLSALFHGVVRHVLPDPHAEQRRLGPNRGLTYWEDGADQRIFFAGGHRLVALDARSGHPAAGFGVQGVVDLTTGLSRPFRGAAYAVSSPGVIYKDVLVLGSMMSEGPEPVPSGEVRAFDVRSGRQRWSFHTVPLKGQAGSETWPAGAAQTVGGANAWAGMVADEARGLIFIPTGSAAFDYFGGDRTGANLFSDSLVAVRGETGQVVWHYQMVHHDLWDYDLPCPPALATVVRGQERVDVVVQATKQGLLFILNRDTGESLFPIEERTVPRSSVPGEQAWATQPFPLAPKPLSRLSITEDGLTDLSPRAHADALKAFRESAGSAIFLPPGLRGTIVIPGFQGGANWGGVSLDPRNGRLLINTNDIPYLLRLVPARKTDAFPYTVANFDNPFVDSEGYPAVKPPWGKLSAVNLNSGEIEWQVPLGEYKELTKRGIPVTGSDNIGGSLLTQSGLAFIGATKDRAFRAFDSDTGRVLWETTLPAAAHATPATYAVNGKQFVVIAAGGGSIAGSSPSGDEYISFSLPN